MHKIALTVAAALTLLPRVSAVSEWGQCGGINWTGGTTCDAGLSCVYQNDWYYQCLPATTTASSAKTTTTTSSVKTTSTTSSVKTTSTTSSVKTSSTTSSVKTSAPISSSTSTKPTSTSSSAVSTATGYVKTNGQKFTLNGSTFNAVGTNAYWLAQLSSSTLIASAFSEIAQAGTTVVRTWGFNDCISTSCSGTYYQSWNGATPTINTGANGLAQFDIVVAQAKAAGIKLVVPLTNNWTDYGGMDLYTSQILGSGQAHGTFYTNAQIEAAYKNYVNVFVSRYKNEPTIMAWELANEPRCNACAASVLTTWATNISAYIKSIDPNHLVALGDEGFFNEPGNASYPYQGGEGVDFVANLAISTLDYGTFHLYPVSWGVTTGYQAWGVQWIADHATAQAAANKPSILEEYGVTSSDRATVYAAWWSEVLSSGLSGDQYWQAGTTASGSGYNDGYAIFTTDAIFPAVQAHEAAMKARS